MLRHLHWTSANHSVASLPSTDCNRILRIGHSSELLICASASRAPAPVRRLLLSPALLATFVWGVALVHRYSLGRASDRRILHTPLLVLVKYPCMNRSRRQTPCLHSLKRNYFGAGSFFDRGFLHLCASSTYMLPVPLKWESFFQYEETMHQIVWLVAIMTSYTIR